MENVLLIEDDTSLQKMYKDKFSSEGVEIEVASNGEEGLSRLKRNGYGLLILDIILPGGINGFDVLEEMKKDEKLKDIPVLVLTNLDSEEKVAKEIGVEDYVIKADITPNELVKRAKKLLEG